jgi:hypothetical protein
VGINNLIADRFPVTLTCNIHPWMNGWVRVFDHPYFAVTDADGKFEIPQAPVGNYLLFVWHESAGFLDGKAGRNGRPVAIVPAGLDVGQLQLSETP